MNYVDVLTAVKMVLVIAAASAIASKCIRLAIHLLEAASCSTVNYQNKRIAVGAGIAFIPIMLVLVCFASLLFHKESSNYIYYIAVICAMGFAGLLDDLIGNKKIKGLKNHIMSTFRGQLTTGFIKAFVGGCVAFTVSVALYRNFFDFTVNFAIVALFTNALNLLDLRPGRCVKFFLIAGVVVFFAGVGNLVQMLPLAMMLTVAAAYLRYDLRELCMLGDTGSNILGVTLGFYSILSLGSISKVMLLIFLLCLNLAAEKVSLTSLIEKNRLLNYLDSLGRSHL